MTAPTESEVEALAREMEAAWDMRQRGSKWPHFFARYTLLHFERKGEATQRCEPTPTVVELGPDTREWIADWWRNRA